ncbi:hypothetical protein ACIKT0_01650 [Hansschlegelia beijingensis]|uniref:hypothetical protein n=1 Tax=Hansschlegelia beijingensis TaxID=1133344 RepID=UPI00387F1CBE
MTFAPTVLRTVASDDKIVGLGFSDYTTIVASATAGLPVFKDWIGDGGAYGATVTTPAGAVLVSVNPNAKFGHAPIADAAGATVTATISAPTRGVIRDAAGEAVTSQSVTVNVLNVLPETAAYLTEILKLGGALPDSTRIALLDGRIQVLKTAGLWDKIVRMGVLAAHTEVAALIDFRRPRGAKILKVKTPVFTVNKGFAGVTASLSYLNTQFQSGWGFTATAGYGAVYHPTSVPSSNSSMGNGTLQINPLNTQSEARLRCCSNTTIGVQQTDGSGLHSVNRNNPLSFRYRRNKTAVATVGDDTSGEAPSDDLIPDALAPAYAGVGQSPMLLCGWAAAGGDPQVTQRQTPLYVVGDGTWNDADSDAFFDIMVTGYLTVIGAA